MARSWEHFGRFLKVLGRHFRACNTSLKRFAEFLKNLQKQYKVLQKSRFGGSEIEEKNSLESNLGPNQMLSWLARLNFGVKIAKLTQFGWLSGTKWALGESLERSKSLQERPKGLNRALGAE